MTVYGQALQLSMELALVSFYSSLTSSKVAWIRSHSETQSVFTSLNTYSKFIQCRF
jgi:hypothetical protein